MINLPELIASSEERLRGRKYRVSRNVTLPDGAVADLVGSRTYFSWKGLVLLSQHLLIQGVEQATVADAQELFEAGFRYAKKVNRIPLLRGVQFGYMVIPCLALKDPDEGLIRYAESQPRKHWSLFEFPVVVNVSAGKIHYFRQTAIWGAFFFSDMRKVVEDCISKAIEAA